MLPTTYSLHARILNLLATISYKLGEVKAAHLERPSPLLQQAYRVSTVHATLSLEGNPLKPTPVADLLAHPGSRSGPARPEASSLEVTNTQQVHDLLPQLDPYLALDFRRAHGELMHNLSMDAGTYRTGPVEVVYGDHPAHGGRSASAENLASLVEELLHFTENDETPMIITSCVLHYGIVYLRPFSAGNGRMARLWQRRVLMAHWPVFAFLPVEAFILKTEPAYHAALEYADRQGDCGGFITYMMERIDEALSELLAEQRSVMTGRERVALFLEEKKPLRFTRKDYRAMFPELYRHGQQDLKLANESGGIERIGNGRISLYQPLAALSMNNSGG
ncbi:MAG: Fic family protein [Flavobacteriales bacterium]|nr:Fic family protein [Flavobacteriales bacterium]